MRLSGVTALACLAAGCGGGADKAQQKPGGSSELTVTLPPTLPTEPAAKEEDPKAGFEAVAAVEPAAAPPAPVPPKPAPKQPEPQQAPAVEVALAPAAEPAAPGEATALADASLAAAAPAATTASVPGSRPPGAAAWASYIRKAGFPCRSIAAADRVERASGAGLQFYRVQCEGGGTYQATNKRGHLYFRRWRG
jgi:hypothetical protein